MRTRSSHTSETIEASIWITTDDLNIQADVSASVDRGYISHAFGSISDDVLADIRVTRVTSIELMNRAKDRMCKPSVVLDWSGTADRAAAIEAVQALVDEQLDGVTAQLWALVPERCACPA